MIPLGDPRWNTLNGGYRVPYDPGPALGRIERGEPAWDELWDNLHHQGDVSEGSYAAVPHVVRVAAKLPSRDFNPYALCATIEIERHARSNPRLPPELQDAYQQAWRELAALALRDLAGASDPYLLRGALAVIALARGGAGLGALLASIDDSELEELLEERLDWSERYRR